RGRWAPGHLRDRARAAPAAGRGCHPGGCPGGCTMSLPGVEITWRPVLDERGRFAEWVRDLSDRSGVYLIRSDPARFTDELLYIGESHSYHQPGQRRSYRGLYRTLTRHFHGHQWSQGTTYDPAAVLVAVILTEPDQAREYQDMLIAAYQPRD